MLRARFAYGLRMSSVPSDAPVPRTRLLILLASLSMIGPFAIDTVFPAFPAMGEDLGVGKLAMQQTLSTYLVAYAAMSLFHGPLSDAYGRKRVILAGVALFVLASIGCAMSTSMTELLTWRVIQGLCAGSGMIVGRAVIRDVYEGHEAHRLMSHVSMIFGIAPAIAPIIGGWIIGVAEWPAIWWFLAAWGGLLWLSIAIGLPETHAPAARVAISPASVWRSSVDMLRNPQAMRISLAAAFNFGALFLYIASAPAFVIELLDLDAQQFGWFFVPTIAGMMSGAWLSGRLAGKLDGSHLARLGFAICGTAALLNLGYNLLVDDPRVPLAVLPTAVLAFGIALVFPVLTLAMLDMYPRQRGAASSMQMFVGLISHTLLAGVVSPLVSHAGLWLATTSATLTLAAWLLWRSYLARTRLEPKTPDEPAAYEPTGRM